MHPLTAAALVDEFRKIAFADSHMAIQKSREGRRPISVAKLLEKDKNGELYKAADSMGSPQDVRDGGDDDPGAAQPKPRAGEPPSKERGERGNIPVGQKYGMVQGAPTAEGATPIPMGEAPNMNPEAKKPRKKGDVPSLDDVNAVDRYDQRDNATTVTGLGQTSSNIGASNSPGEHP